MFGSRNRFDVLQSLEDYEKSFPLIRKGKRQRVEKREDFVLHPKDADECSKRFLVATCADPKKPFRSISAVKVKKEIKQFCGAVERFQPLKDGSVLVVTKNHKQAEKLLQLNVIAGQNVKFEFHPTLNKSRGVIACFDFTYLTDEDLKTELAEYNVIDVKRIQRREEKKGRTILRDTGSFVLTFDSPTLPETIDAYYTILKVRVYVRNPTRCKGCQKWGHYEDQCKNKMKICEKCGLEKHDGDCTRSETCANCGEAHPAWSRQCFFFKKEFAILQLKAKFQISYFEAKRRYNESQRRDESYAKVTAKRQVQPPLIQNDKSQNLNNGPNGIFFTFSAYKDRRPPDTGESASPESPPKPTERKSKSDSQDCSTLMKNSSSTGSNELQSLSADVPLGESSKMDITGIEDISLSTTGKLIRNTNDIVSEISEN